MNLTEWAHAQGIHVTTTYRWYREGGLPVPARKAGRLILVSPDTAADPSAQAGAGLPVVRAGSGSGMSGSRPGERRLLAGPGVPVVVAGHRGRLGRMNTELAEAASAAHHRRLVMVEQSEVTGDLARDMTGVLTSLRARRYGRRPARNRALTAVGCALRDIGLQAVLEAGSTPCGGAG